MKEKKLTYEQIIKDIERSTGMPSYWKKTVLDLISRQKAEIERLTDTLNQYINGELINAETMEKIISLEKQVDELTKENKRLKKFEMYRIKAMKEDKDEIERLTADLISMDREKEGYIATIKDLNKQIDEFVKIARVSDTKKLIEQFREQAVKDTAIEILSMFDDRNYISEKDLKKAIAERYGVGVE